MRAIDAAGVNVAATRYNGMIHDFGLLNVLADLLLPVPRCIRAGRN